MKTLVNKNNPQIRITAPDGMVKNRTNCWAIWSEGNRLMLLDKDNWTLVEEEPVDLEKAAVEYQLKTRGRLNVMGGDAVLSKEEYMKFNSNKDFIAGAKWMAEQMKGGSK